MTVKHLPIPSAILAWCVAAPAGALPIGHHGGLQVHCEPPHFFDANPAADARVDSFQTFSLTASDNTDPATVKAFVNNQPVAVKLDKERSGAYRVEAGLPQPVTQGRLWLKVTADSEDGCDEYKSWFVNVGP